jgi:osmoprotectant transport system substrate-binding protein
MIDSNPPGERTDPMRRHLKWLGVLLALLLLGAACGGNDDNSSTSGGTTPKAKSGPEIKIGAQDFGESKILAAIYKGALENEGFKASTKDVGGFRDVLFAGFKSGDINLAPDYVASQLEFLNGGKGEATSDVDATFAKLKPLLAAKDLVGLDPSSAVDTNSFVVTQKTSDDKNITTLSELAKNGKDLKLGAPQDCETNGFCIPGLKRVYGLDMSSNFVPLDLGVVGDSLNEGAIDVGVVTSTDGRLADPKTGWVLLEDDKHMLAADNVFPTASKSLVDAYGSDLTDVLNSVSKALNTDQLIELNKRYDIDKDDPEDIAATWLKDNGFAD